MPARPKITSTPPPTAPDSSPIRRLTPILQFRGAGGILLTLAVQSHRLQGRSHSVHSLQEGSLMSPPKLITERIFEFLRTSPEGDFEALVRRYPEFTWNDFYLEVSRLHRHGLVTITRGIGIFTIKQAATLS